MRRSQWPVVMKSRSNFGPSNHCQRNHHVPDRSRSSARSLPVANPSSVGRDGGSQLDGRPLASHRGARCV